MSVKRKLQNEIDLLKCEVEKKSRLVEEIKEDQRNEIKKLRDEEQERIIFALQNQRQRINYEKTVQFNKILQQLRTPADKSVDDVETLNTLKLDCNKLAAVQFKKRMTSLSKRFSWRGSEYNLCAMTPIEEEDDETNWMEERHNLITEIMELKSKLLSMERSRSELEVELQEAKDQNELLEFRILEVEESCHNEHIERQIRLDKCMNTDLHLNRKEEDKLKEILSISPWKDLSPHVKNDLIQLLVQQQFGLTRTLEDDGETNKNNNILKQHSPTDDNDNSDVILDNKSDVISQSGETGYSSDDDVNSDTTSPIPSFDEPHQIVNNRNDVNKEFFWSLSEVARRIKESEVMKTNLRAKNEKLEKDLRLSEQEIKEECKKKTVMEEELKLLKTKIDTLSKLILERDQEVRNKEMEFALKMDAMKCERDEIVNKLENRIAANNRIENELREEIENITAAKSEIEKGAKERDEQNEIEKELLMRHINELHKKNKHVNILIEEEEEIYGDEINRSATNEINDIALKTNTLENEVETKQLKQQIFELETKENAYRQTLHQADKLMADVEKNYQERIEEQERAEEQLRARIVQLEQSEKRLRQTLKNNKHNLQVSKFGELIDRLLESEASEQRLKNRIRQLEKQEKDMKQKLLTIETEKQRVEQEVQEQDELLTTVSNLRHLERDLRKRIHELETSEEALKETLSQADVILMERESDLKEKIQYLESELNRVNEEMANYVNENRVAAMADVVANNSKLQFEIDELKQINDTLREKLFSLQSTMLTHTDAKNLLDESRIEKNCYVQLNLDLLEKDSQIEKLSDKIRLLEAGNVPMEFHALSLHAEELKEMKEKLNTFSISVHKCNCCNCANCKLLLDDIEKQVSLLDQIISGSDEDICIADEMKVEENFKTDDNCRIEELLSSEKCTCHNQNSNESEICSRTVQLENELKNKNICIEKCEKQIKILETAMADEQTEFKNKVEELSRSQKEKDDEIEKLRRCVWKGEVTERVLREKYLKKSQHVASANKQIRELEQKIINYSRQLRLFESNQREIENLRDKNHQFEIELKKGRESERKLYAENLHLHHKVESQKERLKSVQMMKKALANKVEHLEKCKRETALKAETHDKKTKENGKYQMIKRNLRSQREDEKNDVESNYCSTSSESNCAKAKSKIPRYINVTSPRDKKEQNDATIKNIEKPFEPVNFHITRKVGQDGLIVAWNVPQFNENISGYLISVNDELHQKVRSANRTKALLNRLQLSSMIKIDIESVNENGLKSNKVRCIWTNDQNLPATNDEYKRKRVVRRKNDYNVDDIESNTSSSCELSIRCKDAPATNDDYKLANSLGYSEVQKDRGLRRTSLQIK